MPAMVQSARSTVLAAGSPPVTDTLKENWPAAPSALTVQLPDPTPVTVPLASTVATAGSLELHVSDDASRAASVVVKDVVPAPLVICPETVAGRAAVWAAPASTEMSPPMVPSWTLPEDTAMR